MAAVRGAPVPGGGTITAMTKLLEQALAEIEKLPLEIQNAVAARILADLTDDRAWAEGFEATSAGQ